MSNWPLFPQHGAMECVGGDQSNSRMSRGTSGSGTKGGYLDLGTLSEAADGFLLLLMGDVYNAQSNIPHAIDVAIYDGASELIVLPDLYFASTIGRAGTPMQVPVPIPVPAGSGIRLRGQSTTGGRGFYAAAFAHTGGWWRRVAGGKAEALGISGTTPTTITAHASANTLGSYASLGTVSGNAAAVLLGTHSEVAIGLSNSDWLLTVGVDPAGGTSFTDVLVDLPWRMDAASDIVDPEYLLLSLSLSAGSSIGVKGRCSVGGDTCYATAYPVLAS